MAVNSLAKVQAYQELVDCGWRRSGTWLYLPLHGKTCCPCYTHRLDVTKFAPSKVGKLLHNSLASKRKRAKLRLHTDRSQMLATPNLDLRKVSVNHSFHRSCFT